MFNRAVILCCLTLLALAPVLAQGAWTAAPGEGIGPLKLSMTVTQVNNLLAPTEVIGSMQNPRYVRYGDFLVEYASAKAVMYSWQSNTVKTKSGAVNLQLNAGIGVGTPFNMVETTFGRNYISNDLKTAKGAPRETYYAYRSLGLGFRTKAGRVAQVDIWAAAK
ncbi:MAG: hypothetical protein KC910_28320 [Candidatus Eremiobacteraeota bacterium]|nr:hypothetical protein [Candidatus Eremiobacteraeota bacterium]